jgi:hypothetical protein
MNGLPIHLILLVFAFVLTAVAAFWNPTPRPHLGWLGMACLCLSFMLP